MGTAIVMAIIGYMVYLMLGNKEIKLDEEPEIPYEVHPDDMDLISNQDTDWWSTLTIDDLKEIETQDNAFKVVLYSMLQEEEGMSEDEALKELGRSSPMYYLTLKQRMDKPIMEGDNAKLPYILKARINQYITEGRINHSKNKSEHFHAMVRRIFRES